MTDYREAFARRLRDRELLVGTFVKSRDPAVLEVLAVAGFDFAVVDAEHVAYGRGEIAAMMTASRAARLPTLVRLPEPGGHWPATVLDAGAAGIVVPQVTDASMAAGLARRMRYGPGGMGFSPSTPAAGYGSRGVAGHLESQPRETVLVCQIEDAGAVANTAAIAAVDGVDAILVGPVDLAVSVGQTSASAPAVEALCGEAIDSSLGAEVAAGLFISDVAAAPRWRERGVTLFLVGSDQGFLAGAARRAVEAVRPID